MPNTVDLAPPPTVVDGLTVVPADIAAIAASLVFDAATSSASGDATVSFVVGPSAGCPFFDLRQPVTQAWLDSAPIGAAAVAHHAFPGAEPGGELRVLASPLAAGSAHTLRLTYGIGTPTGSPVPVSWSPGRLAFRFGFSDLTPARYLEQWVPANLVYDQFALTLDVEVRNTAVPHTPITNGTVTPLGPNRWQIAFPAGCTSLSPMLEVHPTDVLQSATANVVLPVSGLNVTVEAWKFATGAENVAALANDVAAMLSANESVYGRYRHGNRFVVFFRGGGMEYDGGTTTGIGALGHEVFHSWFARGVKPASQPDGWWDEAITVWHDGGASAAAPFDFTAPPVALAPRRPWSRITQGGAYSAGLDVVEGVAAETGAPALRAMLREFHDVHGERPATTGELESLLVARSGRPVLVDAFHRFVYGLADPSPVPDLWLRDDPGHGGGESWSGRFWDSPDVWVRNDRDGQPGHQPPVAGQDNWFYARVRNRGAAAAHFVVTFHAKPFAGMEFAYPADFLPATAAAAGFDLAAGDEAVVSARWPAAAVPPAGAKICLLVAALTRGKHPVAGRHVWEDNSLAQKNVTVAAVASGNTLLIPFLLAASGRLKKERLLIEAVAERTDLEVSLLVPRYPKPRAQVPDRDGFPRTPARDRFAKARRVPLLPKEPVPLTVTAGSPRMLAVEITAPRYLDDEEVRFDVVKRRPRDGRVTGGIAAILHPPRD